MDKFEEYIKARYPVDYEHLKEKYPNVPVGEFYGDEKDLWQLKQTEIDFLNAQLGIKTDQIKGFESEIKKTWQALEEKDKRIEELEKLNEVGRYARQRFINKFIGIQKHIDVNAFKAIESDPECFVICAEDLTEFIKEVLRGDHE